MTTKLSVAARRWAEMPAKARRDVLRRIREEAKHARSIGKSDHMCAADWAEHARAMRAVYDILRAAQGAWEESP